jgi:hypothetical protein
MSNLGKMPATDKNVLFVSMTNAASGAENVLFMAASAIGAPMMFAKKSKLGWFSYSERTIIVLCKQQQPVCGFF